MEKVLIRHFQVEVDLFQGEAYELGPVSRAVKELGGSRASRADLRAP
jgi:hypothetical protein